METSSGEIGWKTSLNHWQDAAVYWDGGWNQLTDLDLAFVITPEPSTLAMLLGGGLIGLLAYCVRRRRNRKA